MSNLYKAFSVVRKDERVIDYNQMIQEKIERIIEASKNKKVDPDGFVRGLDAQVVEALVEEEGVGADDPMKVISSDYETGAGLDVQQAQEQGEQILARAREDAARILEEAKAQAEEMKQAAFQEGQARSEQAAAKELEKARHLLETEFHQKQESLEQEYQERKQQMEPELVEVIVRLLEEAVHVISEEESGMIIDLINNAMKNMEMGSSFLIRVAPDDYPFVVNHQGKIYCAMSKDIQIDILEDKNLEKNECRIETDFGVYDCSLDIQMGNLIKDIKLLSCLS